MCAFCGQTQETEQSLSKLSSVLIRKQKEQVNRLISVSIKTSDSVQFCVNRSEINKSSDFQVTTWQKRRNMFQQLS